MAALLPMSRLPFQYPFRQLCHFWCNRVRPRVAESEFGRSFFSGDFCWSFNGGAQGIAKRVGIFPVGVVDAPQFVVGIRD